MFAIFFCLTATSPNFCLHFHNGILPMCMIDFAQIPISIMSPFHLENRSILMFLSRIIRFAPTQIL